MLFFCVLSYFHVRYRLFLSVGRVFNCAQVPPAAMRNVLNHFCYEINLMPQEYIFKEEEGNIKGVGAMGDISNSYNFYLDCSFFGTSVPPIITIHAAKFH